MSPRRAGGPVVEFENPLAKSAACRLLRHQIAGRPLARRRVAAYLQRKLERRDWNERWGKRSRVRVAMLRSPSYRFFPRGP